jgi:hypothetical protein
MTCAGSYAISNYNQKVDSDPARWRGNSLVMKRELNEGGYEGGLQCFEPNSFVNTCGSNLRRR